MKTASEVTYEILTSCVGVIDGEIAFANKHAISLIKSRDAEIHALYAPVVEALKAFAETDISDIRMSMITDAGITLAAIKEVKG